MIVDEPARLFLLVTQEPIANFKDKFGKRSIAGRDYPLRKRLHQPGDLSEVSLITKTMLVVTICAIQSVVIQVRLFTLGSSCEGQQQLGGVIILKGVYPFRELPVSGYAALRPFDP